MHARTTDMTFHRAPVSLPPAIRSALDNGDPIVVLESTLLAHGLPRPANLETVEEMQDAVQDAGAVPAVVGVVRGRIEIGLNDETLARFAAEPAVEKASRRDLVPLMAAGRDGATTVAGTIACASLAGLPILATGGIGGVHSGGERTLDVSADLIELGRTPITVVCSGAKSILDLGRTLEVLETQGVSVVGYATETFPAFYARDSGFDLSARVTTPHEGARLVAACRELDRGGLIIANPVPAGSAIEPEQLADWTALAHDEAEAQGVIGKALTPFLLTRLRELSNDRTLVANRALLVANARLAGQIAVEHARLKAAAG